MLSFDIMFSAWYLDRTQLKTFRVTSVALVPISRLSYCLYSVTGTYRKIIHLYPPGTLTHWDRRQAIIRTNVGMSLIGPLETNFSEILIKTIHVQEMHLKMSPEKWRLFCLGLNVLMCPKRNKAHQKHVHILWHAQYVMHLIKSNSFSWCFIQEYLALGRLGILTRIVQFLSNYYWQSIICDISRFWRSDLDLASHKCFAEKTPRNTIIEIPRLKKTIACRQ